MSELYTLEQCAEKIDMSVSTIKREIRCGRLIPTRIRAGVRISPRDWEEYLQKCRSVSTEKDGRSAFSMPGDGLAKLLRLDPTHTISKPGYGSASTIVELGEHRSTALRKRSSAG